MTRYNKKITSQNEGSGITHDEKAIAQHTYVYDKKTNTWNSKKVEIKSDDYKDTFLKIGDTIDEKTGVIKRGGKTVGSYVKGRVLESDGINVTIDLTKDTAIREQLAPYLLRLGKSLEDIENQDSMTVKLADFQKSIADIDALIEIVTKNAADIRRPGEDDRDDITASQLWNLKQVAGLLGLETEFVRIGNDGQSEALDQSKEVKSEDDLKELLKAKNQLRLRFKNEKGKTNFMTKFLYEELLDAADTQLPQMTYFTPAEKNNVALRKARIAENKRAIKDFLDDRPMELVYDPYMERNNSAGLADHMRLALGTNALLILMKLGWGILDQGVSKHERGHMIDRVASMAGVKTIGGAARIDASQDDLEARRGLYAKQYAIGEVYVHAWLEAQDKWNEALRALEIGDEDLYNSLKKDVVKVLARPRNIGLATVLYAQDALKTLRATDPSKVKAMLKEDNEPKDVIRSLFTANLIEKSLFSNRKLDLESIDNIIKELKALNEKGQLPDSISEAALMSWLSHKDNEEKQKVLPALKMVNEVLAKPITKGSSFRNLINLRELKITTYEGEEYGNRKIREFILKMPKYNHGGMGGKQGEILVTDMNGDQLKEMGIELLEATQESLEHKAAAIDIIARSAEFYADNAVMKKLMTNVFEGKLNEGDVSQLRIAAAILSEKPRQEIKGDGSIIFRDAHGRSVTVSSDGQIERIVGGSKGFVGDIRSQFEQTLRDASLKRLRDQQRWSAPAREAFLHPEIVTGAQLQTDPNFENIAKNTVEAMLKSEATNTPKPLVIQVVGGPNGTNFNIFAEGSIASRALARAMVYREGQGEDYVKGTVLPKEIAGGFWNAFEGINLTTKGFAEFMNAAGGMNGLTDLEKQVAEFLQRRGLLQLNSAGKWMVPAGKDGAIQGIFVNFDRTKQENSKQEQQRIESKVKKAQLAIKHEIRHGLEEVDKQYASANDLVVKQAISQVGAPPPPKGKKGSILQAYITFLEVVMKYNIKDVKEKAEALHRDLLNQARENAQKSGKSVTQQQMQKIEQLVMEEYLKDPLIRREVVGFLADMVQIRNTLRGETELTLTSKYGREDTAKLMPLIDKEYSDLRNQIEKPLQKNYQDAIQRMATTSSAMMARTPLAITTNSQAMPAQYSRRGFFGQTGKVLGGLALMSLFPKITQAVSYSDEQRSAADRMIWNMPDLLDLYGIENEQERLLWGGLFFATESGIRVFEQEFY